MFKLGLTGGIGSGKTLVSSYLEKMGVPIIDTDKIAKDLTSVGGKAIHPIKIQFGQEAINQDGSLNRSWMRDKIFLDSVERVKLESILHPLIMECALSMASRFSAPYLVFVVPLLVESKNWIDKVDRVCVVDCDLNDQVKRIKSRDNINIVLINKIINSQVSRSMRLKYADDIIYNGEKISIEALHRQILIKHKNWCLLSNKI